MNDMNDCFFLLVGNCAVHIEVCRVLRQGQVDS